MKKYTYSNIVCKPYYNGYRPYYVTKGNSFLLATARPTKADAFAIGKVEVDYMNEKEGK